MGYQVHYRIYNPGQYPDEVQVELDRMTAAGWRVNTAMPAFNELYILWEKETADEPEVKADVPESLEKAAAAPHSRPNPRLRKEPAGRA